LPEVPDQIFFNLAHLAAGDEAIVSEILVSALVLDKASAN
jgi:hypothetical protein